jgi:hypothetical protein
MRPITKEATSKTRQHSDSLLTDALPDTSSSTCPPLLSPGPGAWGVGALSEELAADGLRCGFIPAGTTRGTA